MSYYTVSALVNFILSFFLGVIVFVKNKKNPTNIIFALFAFSVAFWSGTYFFWQISTSKEDAFFWLKGLMAFAIFIPVFYLHLVMTLTETIKKYFLIAVYFIFSTFFLLNLLTPYFISDTRQLLVFKYWPVPGIFFHLFLILWAATVVYSTFLLLRLHERSTSYIKMQTKYLFWGMFIGFLGGSTNYLLWYGILIPPMGNILVSVYVAMTGYAIVKHRLLDIRLIFARTLSFTLLLGFLSLIYAGIFGIASVKLINTALEPKTVTLLTLLALLVGISFQPLRFILERATERIFFRGKYNTNKLLYELALIMASTLSLGDLTTQVLKQLLTQMRISNGGFVLIDNGNLYRIFTEGFKQELKIDKSQLKVLYKYETLIFDEIPEGETKEVMRQLNLRIVIPLKTQSEEIGIFILGDKLSGDIYTSEDIRVLETLAPEIAIAVQNAKAFEEIKKFNITLQQEVDKSTKGLQVANQKLKELDLLKDDFVSVASHELRTPMTAIRSYAWMALHKSDIPLSQKLERYLYRTLVSTERLINLVNDMLNVSRIESGKIEINPKAFDIVTLVRDVVEEVRAKSEEKKLIISIMEHALPQVFADIDKVHQILLNLVGNSLKFCYPGGNIIIDFFVSENAVEISIKDNGAGIAKEDLSKLFHKFSRLDASYTSFGTSGGTGLGLFISKNLIQLMHGEIKASSEGVDKGTTVTFSLPVATKELIGSGEKYHVKPQDGEAKMLEPVAI